MILTKSSLNNLNKSMGNPVSALQFRPNIFVDEMENFNEDWEWVKIGENAVLRKTAPFTRYE